MTTTTTEPKKRKILMSERPPVRIDVASWPLIAQAGWHSGEHACQANEEALIRVRRREPSPDGPVESHDVLVYGVRESGPGGMPIGYRGRHAGYLLETQVGRAVPTDEIVRAIRRVAGVLDMPELADECIADLPAEDL